MVRLPFLTVIMFLFAPAFGYCQTDMFTDSRDGILYSTIEIGGVTWFASNLRFQTQNSFCPKFNKGGFDCSEGNYYSNTDLADACPTAWHVATIADWKTYLNHMSDSSTVFKVDSFYQFKNSEMVNLTLMTTMNLELLSGENPLKFKAQGWIQGKKIRNRKTLTYWISPVDVVDNKYHVHASNNKYVYHSHKHNIEDIPRKQRMFGVRCVKD